MWISIVFKFTGLSPCHLELNEREGACSSISQSMMKAIWAHGSWEGCLPGEGLSFRTPQFLTEHKMIFLNVSNYICGGVGGEVHKCDRKRNCFRNKDLFSAHTAMMVFQALHWMPLEGLHRKACVESWTEQYCSRLTCSWEKSKPGASLACSSAWAS